ncbi:hypothetical protein ACFVWX_16145 [Streptomyces sp. NPDC058220]|uniref:hypothetical protein n=1 Tax=Streptomyces sp. NPDC058220 TaxID=3346387 RepID=UPI0036EE6A40
MGRIGRRGLTGGIGCVLALCAAVTGCGSGGTSGPDTRDTPAAHRTTPAELCASLVSYWAKEALKGSQWAGLDWEQKGLSNEQYVIHDDVLSAARAERRKHGTAAAEALIDRETKKRCTAQNGATGSSENWRAPK